MQTAAFPGEKRFIAGVVLSAVGIAAAISTRSRDLFWVVGFAAGVALATYALAVLRRCHVASTWETRPGRIISASIENVFVPNEASNTEYRPRVAYEYESAHGVRTGSMFAVSPSLFRAGAWGDVSNLLLSYMPGAEITAKVCPTASEWAVLRTDMLPRRRSHVLAALLGGVLVMLISAVVGLAYAP